MWAKVEPAVGFEKKSAAFTGDQEKARIFTSGGRFLPT